MSLVIALIIVLVVAGIIVNIKHKKQPSTIIDPSVDIHEEIATTVEEIKNQPPIFDSVVSTTPPSKPAVKKSKPKSTAAKMSANKKTVTNKKTTKK